MNKQNKNDRLKFYNKNIYPGHKITIDGPVVIFFEQINSFGQAVFNFVIDRKTKVEVYTIDEDGDINGNK